MHDHAPQGPVRRPGLLGWLALLPGVLIGFCLGAWMLAIALEWLGDAFFLAEHLRQPQRTGIAGNMAVVAEFCWRTGVVSRRSDTCQR